MILVFIIVFCAIVALGFGAAAAWSDISRLKIPNLYAACIGAAFIPAFISTLIFAPEVSYFSAWKSHVIAGVLVFGITYVLFCTKLLGGGDAKMLSVYSLWVGITGLMPLLFGMAVVGGALGVATLLLKKWQPVKSPAIGSWIAKSQKGGKDVPYGVAIFAGALLAFWQIGYLQPEAILALAQVE